MKKDRLQLKLSVTCMYKQHYDFVAGRGFRYANGLSCVVDYSRVFEKRRKIFGSAWMRHFIFISHYMYILTPCVRC